ncbi:MULTISPECIES: hypothetical protein [Acinetobacter calcoaceticus/baumannii complex]|uniref:hypothetical protein n=1 Tax=Acinetobacter calcoaceticus/baumannii complex TaxID=909768 RepID=UPI001250CC73|nr:MULTISPECIES: hypothetical protein [Acinetobacter calcoaceticus/baumannii complex]MBR7681738.1 hypothetical protein [Acinetobacter nosocomialis]
MKKKAPIIDYSEFELGFQNRDYKTDQLMHDTFQNLQNVNKWLYLGADITNHSWAKIGITTGDLRSRSYSSANPNYYIFCAFQFKYNVTIDEMRKVEVDMLNMFDQDFLQMYGDSRRLKHYESKTLSECYCPVNFSFVFEKLHDVLFNDYSFYFKKIGHENEFGDEVGATLICEFNPTFPLERKKSLLSKLMQW